MEDNMLKQLSGVTITTHASLSTATTPIPATTQRDRWPNGDVVMTWNILRAPAARCGLHRYWEVYRDELKDGSAVSTPGPSPSIKAEFSSPAGSTDQDDTDLMMSDNMAADTPGLGVLEPAASLIRNYVIHIHSKSPILNLDFLRSLEGLLLKDGQVKDWSVGMALPAGIQAPDMAIFLLVLALGEISTQRGPREGKLGRSHYINLALPWLGFTAFSGGTPIKDLQARLLLASYHMWILEPWEAWCYIGSATSNAEMLLLRYPDIIKENLSHRVLWAVAKMQLKLAEEIYPHLEVVCSRKMEQLIQSTQIPPPPAQPFEWPGIGSDLVTDTWYYYLAETSSRRLVERIKTEPYEGYSGSDKMAHLTTIYPLACELERQINEWMGSLPADFQALPQPTPDDSRTEEDFFVLLTKQRTQKILRNRQGQLLMLVFRPFLAALADAESEPEASYRSTIRPLLDGTKKYLYHAMTFLTQQAKEPERHYGCWLLARNIWSTALSLVAAGHIPVVVQHMGEAELEVQQAGHINEAYHTSRHVGNAFYTRALDAAEGACGILRRWENESPSLSICADQLWALILDLQRHRSSTDEGDGF